MKWPVIVPKRGERQAERGVKKRSWGTGVLFASRGKKAEELLAAHY